MRAPCGVGAPDGEGGSTDERAPGVVEHGDGTHRCAGRVERGRRSTGDVRRRRAGGGDRLGAQCRHVVHVELHGRPSRRTPPALLRRHVVRHDRRRRHEGLWPEADPRFFQPAQRPTPFTPIRQSGRTGAGTATNPWRVVTLVAAGSTGVQIQQTDTWTATSEVVRTRLDIANRAGVPQRVTVWRAGDCQADAFESFGRVRPGKAACIVSTQDGPDHLIARPVPGAQVMMFAGVGGTGQIGLNGGLGPIELAARIVSGAAPTGGCEECNESRDRALALGWRFTIAARNARTVATTTTVSTGWARPLPALTLAPAGAAIVGGPCPPAGRRRPRRRRLRPLPRDGTVTCVAVTDGAGRATCNTTRASHGRRRGRRCPGRRPVRHGDVRRRPRPPPGLGPSGSHPIRRRGPP